MAQPRKINRVNGACVNIDYLVLGMIGNNVFIVEDGNGVIVVDPSARPEAIMAAVGDRPVDAIFVTHNHADHVGALAQLKQLTGAPVIASAIDAPVIEAGQNDGMISAKACSVDVKVEDGSVVEIADTAWKVLHTPGHTKGGICFFLDPSCAVKKSGSPVLLSGDTLFCGSIGRTDFEGGNFGEMRRSLKYLAKLPDTTIVCPGHEALTTIGSERKRVFAYYA